MKTDVAARLSNVMSYVVAALLFGGLLLFGCARAGQTQFDEEEDRPPIIVKGGTLDVESGLSNDRPGKHWKVKGQPSDKTWEQDHDKGKPVKAFQLYWDAGTLDSGQPCEPTVVDEVRIVYDPDDGGNTGESTYYVEVEKGGGKRVTKARGDFTWSSAAPTKLTAPGESKTIVSVTGYYEGTQRIKCNKPTRAFIEAFRP